MLLVAVLKPFFPNNVGIVTVNGEFLSVGLQRSLPPGTRPRVHRVEHGAGSRGRPCRPTNW
jgi:hypothetical protein